MMFRKSTACAILHQEILICIFMMFRKSTVCAILQQETYSGQKFLQVTKIANYKTLYFRFQILQDIDTNHFQVHFMWIKLKSIYGVYGKNPHFWVLNCIPHEKFTSASPKKVYLYFHKASILIQHALCVPFFQVVLWELRSRL